jgi:uncharacterized membrane protein HdeD (DUF308 family)
VIPSHAMFYLVGICVIFAGTLTVLTSFLVSRPGVYSWPTFLTGVGLIALGLIVLLVAPPDHR